MVGIYPQMTQISTDFIPQGKFRGTRPRPQHLTLLVACRKTSFPQSDEPRQGMPQASAPKQCFGNVCESIHL